MQRQETEYTVTCEWGLPHREKHLLRVNWRVADREVGGGRERKREREREPLNILNCDEKPKRALPPSQSLVLRRGQYFNWINRPGRVSACVKPSGIFMAPPWGLYCLCGYHDVLSFLVPDETYTSCQRRLFSLTGKEITASAGKNSPRPNQLPAYLHYNKMPSGPEASAVVHLVLITLFPILLPCILRSSYFELQFWLEPSTLSVVQKVPRFS